MTEHSETFMTCGSCGLPIHPSESGLRYFGTHTSHSAHRCVELLKGDLAAALERAERAEAELELAGYERSSAAEAASILFAYLEWTGGGLGAAAIETVERAKKAETERDAAVKDAERYRWLRDDSDPGRSPWITDGLNRNGSATVLEMASADAAIDAAIAEGKK